MEAFKAAGKLVQALGFGFLSYTLASSETFWQLLAPSEPFSSPAK